MKSTGRVHFGNCMRLRAATYHVSALSGARRRARLALTDHGEQPFTDLDDITYTQDQVLGPWLP